jgi:acyl-homoserine lactone acylase PvdQ
MRHVWLICAAIALAALMAPAALAQPYGENDGGGFHDVLPPGTNGFDNALQLAQFVAIARRPPHADDQLAMYGNLLYGYPGLTDATLGSYYKDSTFGVKPGDVESTEHPRPDVTIVRDRFGVPHIYGTTRDATEFGVGYATAEDRLFFIDVLRHVGRAELSSFVGGAASNRLLDAQVWAVAPYTEQDLQRQVDYRPPGYEAQADRLRGDADAYVAGVNRYIAEARLNPLKMPAEYAAIGQPQGPQDFKPTDVVATSTLVGAIFGAGGGQELESALTLEDAQARFGRRAGAAVWRDFREADDPEAPTTVRGRSFPYGAPPKHPRGVALPDPGSVRDLVTLNPSSTAGQTPSTGSQGGGPGPGAPGLPALPPLPQLAFGHAHSNAILISARDSASGHPLAVFGPQVAYFAPEILMEEDVHGPGIDARGAAFPGTNLYVQLGHGRDYAWSATSAGQDVTDTFAVPLCEPGGKPTLNSQHYLYRGRCLPIETLARTNSWHPNLADQTPAGSETLNAQRTALGIVVGRATIKRRPYAYTSLRTTYLHETDSALAFSELNDPNQIRGPSDFQRAAYLIGYTFNWFYVDAAHSAYFNSGENPVRAPSTDPSLPIASNYEWRGYDPTTRVTAYAPASTHPQAVDQAWMTSWNNKQAARTRASDGEWGFGPVYRSQLLDERVSGGLRRGKLTLPQVVQAMEDAASVDLRGDLVLPWALRVLEARRAPRVCARGRGHRRCHRPRYRRPAILRDPAVRAALSTLRAWHAAGSHRRETRPGSRTYQYADAIRIMDAWWPAWIAAEFEPTLGKPLFGRIEQMIQVDNPPNNGGQHLGSAYQDGWYGYAQKDLRTLLGLRVRGRYSRAYCGGGSLARCQAALAAALKTALSADPAKLYADAACKQDKMEASQWCYDTIAFRPLGAITEPRIAWQNRPTYQQAVSVQHPVGR